MAKQNLKLVTKDSGNRAAEIISLHGEIKGHLENSLKKALRLGCLLSAQKESLQHGQFGPWIKSNLPFTDRMARSYMRIYNQRSKLKTEGVSVLADALRSLQRPPALPEGKLQLKDEERAPITFSTNAGERGSIELALEAAKALFETKSNARALEGICLDWLESVDDPKAKS